MFEEDHRFLILTIIASSSSVLSPNLKAKSQTACVTEDTLISSSYVNA